MSQYKYTIHSTESSLQIIQFQSGPMQNLQYLVLDPTSKTMAVVDPAWNIAPIIDFAAEFNVTITQIWVTHGHFDHVNQLNNLINAVNGTPTIVLFKNPLFKPDSPHILSVDDASIFEFGNTQWNILYTPGHSPDSICFQYSSHLICGDLLFVDACGRSDLPGSNPAEMKSSLVRISKLPRETVIYPGHDYGPTLTDTIGNQLESNPNLIFSQRRSSVTLG